jgi:DNA modification methylase
VPELLWKGKYRNGVRVVRTHRTVHVRTEEIYGSPSAAWHNRLVLGDVTRALTRVAEEFAGAVALVYVDPPFDTGGTFDFQATIPGAPEGAPRIRIPAYRDARGLDAWLAWFFEVAVLLRALLTDGGSLYVHLDAHAAHYAKVVLDEVFGERAFQREIVWRIGWVSGFKSRARSWIRNHDTLLYYAKGGRVRTFHKEYVPYPSDYVRRDGARPRGEGYPIDDVWNGSDLDRMDSIQIVSFSGEKVGYPTQKNESLVARIVRASSDPGDLVLDGFVGSGTTAVVAEKLGRRWIVCDSSPIAVHSARKRLLSMKVQAPFVLQRVGGSPEKGQARKLTVRGSVDGKRAAIELAAFALPPTDVPREAGTSVTHWSQWIEGWCVDWDYRGETLQAGSRLWRVGRAKSLPVRATHTYDRPGRYDTRVKVFDVLGGSTTRTLRMDVR